jgi:CubicO group peptidase (beta-lactamase class C family)
MRFNFDMVKALACFIWLGLASVSRSSAQTQEPMNTLSAHADQFLSAATALGFSGQVLIAQNGQISLHRSYGLANRATLEPMTLDTRMGAGSVAKVFTAAAILRLVDQRKLTLTDHVSKYIEVPDNMKGRTIHNLLTHTDLKHEWNYSGRGYELLASIVERLSGRPFFQTQRDLFDSADMQTAALFSEPGQKRTAVAHAYVGSHDNGPFTQWPSHLTTVGPGDVALTALDLYKWNQAWVSGRIVSDSLRALAESALAPIQSGVGYGYGLFVWTDSTGKWAIEHGGDDLNGYNAAYFFYPQQNAVLIVVTNARDHEGRGLRQAVQKTLEEMVLGRHDHGSDLPRFRSFSNTERSLMAGSYRIPGGSFHIIDAGGPVYLAAEGQTALNAFGFTAIPDADSINRQVARILAVLHRSQPDSAFAIAMNSDTSTNVKALSAWWQGYTKTNGALLHGEVLGSIAAGENVHTYIRLRLVDRARSHLSRTLMIRFVMSAKRPFVLRGVNPERVSDYPIVFPVAKLGTRYFARDLFSSRSVAMRLEGEDLIIDTTRTKRSATNGWIPQPAWPDEIGGR